MRLEGHRPVARIVQRREGAGRVVAFGLGELNRPVQVCGIGSLR
jgi:hypothetical protein